MAIADGGERLDTEKKGVHIRTRSQPGDGSASERVEFGENQIQDDIDAGDESGEFRPLQSQQPLIDIAILPSLQVKLEKDLGIAHIESRGASGMEQGAGQSKPILSFTPLH